MTMHELWHDLGLCGHSPSPPALSACSPLPPRRVGCGTRALRGQTADRTGLRPVEGPCGMAGPLLRDDDGSADTLGTARLPCELPSQGAVCLCERVTGRPAPTAGWADRARGLSRWPRGSLAGEREGLGGPLRADSVFPPSPRLRLGRRPRGAGVQPRCRPEQWLSDAGSHPWSGSGTFSPLCCDGKGTRTLARAS